MNKRELIQLIISVSYNSGYRNGQEDIQKEQEFDRRLDNAYKHGKEIEEQRIVAILEACPRVDNDKLIDVANALQFISPKVNN